MNSNRNRVTIEAEGFSIIIDHHNPYDWRRQPKARVYVDGEEEVDFTEAYALQRANGYQNRGVNPEEDKLFAKLNRQVVKNKKAVIEEALQTVEALGDVLVKDNKLTFSRTAGCGCGCSPAFVPKSHIVHDGLRVESIFITKKKENA